MIGGAPVMYGPPVPMHMPPMGYLPMGYPYPPVYPTGYPGMPMGYPGYGMPAMPPQLMPYGARPMSSLASVDCDGSDSDSDDLTRSSDSEGSDDASRIVAAAPVQLKRHGAVRK
jgi:hypothetical protein